jgi:hypothetical protein
MLIYLSYLRAFRKYANSLLNISTDIRQIRKYANFLTEKVAELCLRAKLNNRINLSNLQRDLYQCGKAYIKKFSNKFNKKVIKQHNNYPIAKENINKFPDYNNQN